MVTTDAKRAASPWVEIQAAPDELDRVNETATARALGGFSRVRMFVNVETRELRVRLITNAGASRAKGAVP